MPSTVPRSTHLFLDPRLRSVTPGICTPPTAKYSRVVPGLEPGQQWNSNGGFCGAFSVQHAALGFGAWVSQDLVRKANRLSPGPHNEHGDRTLGYEVMPSNVVATAEGLKLSYTEWDYTQPKPQAAAYKKWLKSHLVQGHPIVWFPICKGDSHKPYPDSCPGGGAVDHVEPMWGIFSNHSLDDENVYDDDWILHASDQDYEPYFRPLNSLDDSTRMEGNCRNAGAGFGKNEMYPCFDEDITYGLAISGLNISGATLPTSISTSGAQYEPQIRSGESPTKLTAKVTVTALTAGARCAAWGAWAWAWAWGTPQNHTSARHTHPTICRRSPPISPRLAPPPLPGRYTTFRYAGTDTLPSSTSDLSGFEYSHAFTASAATYEYSDPNTFLSSSAVYYVTVAGAKAAAPETKRAARTGAVPVVPGLGMPLVNLGTGSGQHADVAAATALWMQVGPQPPSVSPRPPMRDSARPPPPPALLVAGGRHGHRHGLQLRRRVRHCRGAR